MAEKVVFLGMGGTIAGTATAASDNVGYRAGQIDVQQLLLSVPGLIRILGDYVPVVEQVRQMDSKDMAHGDWAALGNRLMHFLQLPDVRSVVVTHGTDTLEETAYWLSRVLPRDLLRQKAVVITCAMRPASSPTADGPGNLADAASLACSAGAHGLVVVCAGKIWDAAHVQKVHPYRLDAFDAGEVGALGAIEEGEVRLFSGWPTPQGTLQAADCALMMELVLPRVEIVVSHAGASGAMVRSVVRATEDDVPVRGIVVAGTGNGTIHSDLEAALHWAREQGVRVARVSRCAYGRVVEAATPPHDAFPVYGISAVKARVALMLDIAIAT